VLQEADQRFSILFLTSVDRFSSRDPILRETWFIQMLASYQLRERGGNASEILNGGLIGDAISRAP
jgi:hypothetical protein